MASPIQPFTLPSPLPTYSGKATNAQKYTSLTKARIEEAINHIFAGKNSEEDNAVLVKFMRMLSKDPSWMRAHTKAAQAVMRAASMCYLTAGQSPVAQKIGRLIQKNWRTFGAHTLPDINVKLSKEAKNGRRFSFLFLAAQSPMFDRMFRGSFQEANQLKLAYSDPRAGTLIDIVLPASPDTFKAFFDIMIEGKCERSDNQALLQFSDMTDSVTALLDNASDIVFSNLTQDLAAQVVEKLQMRNPKLDIEAYLLSKVSRENAEVLYKLAKTKGFTKLTETALYPILSTLDLHQAIQGATSRQVMLKGESYAGAGVAAACLNRVVLDLPRHFRDQAFRTNFCTLLTNFQQFNCPAFKELSTDQLEWLIKHLPQNATVLDLSHTKLSDFDILKKLPELRVLKVAGLSRLTSLKPLSSLHKLEELDLSECRALKKADFEPYYNLTNLTLAGCDIKPDKIKGLQNCRKLQSIIVEPHLRELLARLGFRS